MVRSLLIIFQFTSHKVYEGYWKFFDKYFSIDVYSEGSLTLKGAKPIKRKKTIGFTGFGVNIYNKDDFDFDKYDFVYIGHLVTNSIGYLKNKKFFYFSEYFNHGKPWWKNMVYFMFGYVFFRNRKVIVPTKKSLDTISKFSKNVFYFPQIYYGKLVKNKKESYGTVKLLFAGRLYAKNKGIDLIFEAFKKYESKYNIEITFIGNIRGKNKSAVFEYLDEVSHYKNIKVIDYVNYEELSEIYQENDVLLLPSKTDPIGSTVLEAMAHGNAILVSDGVGASDYIENKGNGLTFKSGDKKEFEKCFLHLISNPKILSKYKAKSYEIVKDKYWFENKGLMDKIYKKLQAFLNK